MNPLNNFREFLHSGDEQLLDIFEDYGEERPAPVMVYWTLIYHENVPKNEEDLVKWRKSFCNYNRVPFNSTIEALAYARGLGDCYNTSFIFGVAFTLQQLIDNLESQFRLIFS